MSAKTMTASPFITVTTLDEKPRVWSIVAADVSAILEGINPEQSHIYLDSGHSITVKGKADEIRKFVERAL